jgi:hypothetical protein
MNQTNGLMLAVLGVMLFVGLIAIPILEQAQARSETALERNKGKQGFRQSDGQGGRDPQCEVQVCEPPPPPCTGPCR